MAGFLTDVKKQAAKNFGSSLSRTGILGAAIGKTFAKKFGADEEDTQVADALKEQGALQSDNSAVLARIESVVMNIADNVYNLAAVMNAHVTSMKEAQRIQQEKAFKDAASSEEATAEAIKVSAPTPAATEGDGKKEKGGMIGNILGAVKSTKSMFKGFLKKFGILAIGLTATLGIAAELMKVEDDTASPPSSEAPPATTAEPPAPPPEPPAATAEPVTPPAEQVPPPRMDSPSSMISSFAGMIEKHGGERGAADATAMKSIFEGGMSGGAGGFMAATQAHAAANPQPSEPSPSAPAATPAAPPPPVAGTSQKDQEAEKLREYFDRPENAADSAQIETLWKREQGIKTGIRDTKWLIANASSPEEKARHEDILKNQLEPGLQATKEQRRAILNKGREAVGIATAPMPAVDTAARKAGFEESIKRTSPEMVGGGGSGEAVPVAPAPSGGADIGTASTAVAAASEPQQPKQENIDVSSSKDSGIPPGTGIPTPVADRGSLDVGTTFDSGG